MGTLQYTIPGGRRIYSGVPAGILAGHGTSRTILRRAVPMDIFSDEVRRNPYALYEQMRSTSPVYHVSPPFDGWMIFEYEAVKRVLNDHETFSSQVPAPPHWFVFLD